MTIDRMRFGQILISAALVFGLDGCSNGHTDEERIRSFCKIVYSGERYATVQKRFSDYGVQQTGFAAPPQVRLKNIVPDDSLNKTTGIVIESSGQMMPGPRPVCAIYYSDELLGGNDKVILAEFVPNWRDGA